MIIDFHTHAFADSIAERAIVNVGANIIGTPYESRGKPSTNGTLSDLSEKLDEWGVDKAVVLPIATKPSQQTVINNWAAQNNHGRFFFYGSVHPCAQDVLEELERIKALGLYGIKLHPDYQDFFANDDKLIPIYKKCAELGLPVILHAGEDVYSPECIHCTPEMSADILDKVPEMTLILAHFGGNGMWDKVEKYLVGRNVYFDTAFAWGNISSAQAERIVKNHGTDKILFASDCPWSKSVNEINLLESFNLSVKEKEQIYSLNALKLLHKAEKQE